VGKKVASLSDEYGIVKSTINKWVKDYSKSGSFSAKNNQSQEENDILKQAAIIMSNRHKV